MSRPFNAPDTFRAIADPTRRRILDLLRTADRSPGDLAGQFRLSRPSISQHLRTLRLAGLVREQRRGKGLVYSLASNPMQAVFRWAAPFRN